MYRQISLSDRKIYLTFELNEFSTYYKPEGLAITQNQLAATREGLRYITPILVKHNANATFITTLNFATENILLLKGLSERFEIALHAYGDLEGGEDVTGKDAEKLGKIVGKNVTVIQMPIISGLALSQVEEAGDLFENTIVKDHTAGSFHKALLSKTSFSETRLFQYSAGSAYGLQFLINWLSFKNLPYWYFRKMATKTLYREGNIRLYFAPWEFSELEELDLPVYLKKISGKKLANRLDRLLGDLRNGSLMGHLKDYY